MKHGSAQNAQTSASLMPKAMGLVQLALLALIVFVLVRAVMTFLAPSSVWPQAEVNSVPAQAAQSQSAQTVRFNGFDAFHRAASNDAPTAAPSLGANAPETTLRLKLTGRRAGPNGSAILELPDRSQASFGIGDEIIDGVTLRAVEPDYIVIAQSGRLERLTFDKERVMEAAPVEEPRANGLKDLPIQTQDGVSTMTLDMRDQQINVQTLITQNSLTQVRRDGASIGLRITPKSSNSGLGALGLEPGDIVQRIGRVDVRGGLGNPAALQAELAGNDTISVTILRGDTVLTVDIAQ